MGDSGPQKAFEPITIQSVADTVFEELHQQILSLELPPGTKISEAEVAKAFGVSRQPVRDAFYRLSQLGFLSMRPQRATAITAISIAGVRKAKFVREALETACWGTAMAVITDDQFGELDAFLSMQRAAADENDQRRFHELDEGFHRHICAIAGHDYVWALIREQKAHMDRVRFITLTPGAARRAHDDHVKLVAALRAGERPKLQAALSEHLGRIDALLAQISREKPAYFQQ